MNIVLEILYLVFSSDIKSFGVFGLISLTTIVITTHLVFGGVKDFNFIETKPVPERINSFSGVLKILPL